MVYLRNLFLLVCICALSVAKLSAQVTPVSPAKPLNNAEDVELRMMMVDALLELNDAMLQGVKASIDTLNLPENAQTIKEKDMQTTLIRMKRMRDRTLLMPYLEHIQDSIRNEIVLLQKEKRLLEQTIDPMKPLQPAVLKADTLVAGRDTLVFHTTIDPNSGLPTQTVHSVTGDVTSETPTAEAKRSDKKKKKQPQYFPMDTVLVFDLGSNKPEPEAKRPEKLYPTDTAGLAKVISDTTGIKIKLPNSEDSIVIKPVKTKKKPEPAIVFVDSVITPGAATTNNNTAYISNTSDISTDSVQKIKAEFFLQRARTGIFTKNYKNAEQYLEKAIELYPDYYDAWLTRAEMFATTGDDNNAIAAYNKTIELDSTKPNLYYGIAMIYIKGNKKADALKLLDKAIHMNPKYVEALMARAAIYKEEKRYLEGIVEYNRVVKADITHYQAYKERGLLKMMVKDYNEAADDFTRFLIFEPNEASAYYNRGLCRLENKELLDGCSDLATASDKGYKDAEKAIKKYCE